MLLDTVLLPVFLRAGKLLPLGLVKSMVLLVKPELVWALDLSSLSGALVAFAADLLAGLLLGLLAGLLPGFSGTKLLITCRIQYR